MRTANATAIAYLRVSTDEQHLGPEAQRAAIEAWAAREAMHVVAWHVDRGVSGAAPLDRRPALLEAVDALPRGGVLVVAKRDRLARDVVIAAMIERAAARVGASVVSADGVGVGDGPEAALLRAMVDAFAQYERALIRTRTKGALQAKRRKGERVGGVPFGYHLADDGTHVVRDDAEQRTLVRVHALARDGLSQRAIAELLNAELVPARGNRWHATTVARLLARAPGGVIPPESSAALTARAARAGSPC